MFERLNFNISKKKEASIPVLLVGSEESSDDFIRGTERRSSSYKAIGIISESNIDSKEYLIRGVPVLGSLKGISEVLSRLSKNNLPQRLVIVSSNIKSRDVSELIKISEKAWNEARQSSSS